MSIIAVVLAWYKMNNYKIENSKLKWKLLKIYCYVIPIEQQTQEVLQTDVIIKTNNDHNK